MLRKGVEMQALQPCLHLLNKPAKTCTAPSSPQMPLPRNGLTWQLQRGIKTRNVVTTISVFSFEGPSLRAGDSGGKGSCGYPLQGLGGQGFISPLPKLFTPMPLRVGWHYLEERPEVGPHAHPHWRRVGQGPALGLGVAVVGLKARHC